MRLNEKYYLKILTSRNDFAQIQSENFGANSNRPQKIIIKSLNMTNCNKIRKNRGGNIL